MPLTLEEQNKLMDEFFASTKLIDDEEIDWHNETDEDYDPDE